MVAPCLDDASHDRSHLERSQAGGRSSSSNPVEKVTVPCYARSERRGCAEMAPDVAGRRPGSVGAGVVVSGGEGGRGGTRKGLRPAWRYWRRGSEMGARPQSVCGPPRSTQFEDSYSAMIAAGIRPRSLTLWPRCFAHALISELRSRPGPLRERRRRPPPPPATRRACSTYLPNFSRRSLACVAHTSIS